MKEGLLALAIVGTLQGLKLSQYGEKVQGVVTVLVAALLGLLAGLSGLDGMTPVTGLLTGLAASGAVTVIDRVKA